MSQTDRIRRFLAEHPGSHSREIVERTGLRRNQVASRLCAMLERDEVTRTGTPRHYRYTLSGPEGKGSSSTSPPAQASPPPASAPLATPMSLGGEVEGTGRCSPQAPSPPSGTWRAA